MPTLSKTRAGIQGEGMATQRASAPFDSGGGGLVVHSHVNIRMRDGSVETAPDVGGPLWIKKIMITHDSASDNWWRIEDHNGTLFKMFLHQADLRQVPGIANRRPPPDFLVEALDTAFTSKTEIIDFPEPGLYAEGDLGFEAGVNSTTDVTIYYTYATPTPEPTP